MITYNISKSQVISCILLRFMGSKCCFKIKLLLDKSNDSKTLKNPYKSGFTFMKLTY